MVTAVYGNYVNLMKLKNLVIILCCARLCIYAQKKSAVFNLIFSVGVSPSQVHGDSYSGFNKVGFIGGTGLETLINEKFSVNGSFLFIQKGARKNQDIEKGDLNYYYLNLNYVELPLNIVYLQKKFLFDCGLAAGYLINYYEASEIGNFTGLYPFKKFEYSVKVGLGYVINKHWFANVRSSNSFITIRPNRIKQAIYYNNIIARTFNKGYYDNILEFTLSYKLISKPKS